MVWASSWSTATCASDWLSWGQRPLSFQHLWAGHQLPKSRHCCLTVSCSQRTPHFRPSVCHLKHSGSMVFSSLTASFLFLPHHLRSVSMNGFLLLFSSSLCSKSPDASNSSFFISIRISTLFSMATFLAPVRHSFLGLPYARGSGVVPQFFISSDPVSDCLLGSLLFKGVQRAFYLQMWGLWQPSWLRSLPFASSVPLIPSLFLLTV